MEECEDARSLNETEEEAARQSGTEGVGRAHCGADPAPNEHGNRQDDRRPARVLHEGIARDLHQDLLAKGSRQGGQPRKTGRRRGSTAARPTRRGCHRT